MIHQVLSSYLESGGEVPRTNRRPRIFTRRARGRSSLTCPSRTLGEAHFVAFAGITGDNHPLHYDVVYCKEHGHPERLSHGLLNVSQNLLGASSLAPRVHESMVAFLEQTARFLGPVYVGDTLHPALIVQEVKPGNTTGTVTLRCELHNQRGELVLEGTHKYLVRKRGGEG